jgi:8-oxo-dGTP pyrophosphatase MutT (NUDIX family)
MTEKDEPRYEQAGVIAFRRAGEQIEIALITSASGRRWVIPKGLIDPGETPSESAQRETAEEAGLVGSIDPAPVGTYEYRKWGGTCHVEVFLLEVETELDAWPEQEMRERRWFSIDEACGLIREPELVALIRRVS